MNPRIWKVLDEHFADIERTAGRVLTRALELPSDDDIARAELELGCKFDEDYAEFLRRYGGATVGSLPVFGLRPVEATGEPWTVLDVTHEFRKQQYPGTANWYVVADDGYGNAIGIAPDGRVLVTEHDAGGISTLAWSFEEFLLRHCLRLPPDPAQRELFVSEARYIHNILWKNYRLKWDSLPPVVSEYYAPPRVEGRGPRFNLDYVLRFVEDDARGEHISTCARVLPNTMGAEVFVAVDAVTGKPLMTELDSGEAFPIKYFKRYIEQVESELMRLGVSIELRTCTYCRVFVIERDICFLAFPDDTQPVTRGQRRVLRDDNDACIVSYLDNDRLVCVDGWLKTEVPHSDRYLVATPRA